MIKRISRRLFLGAALGGFAGASLAGAPAVSLRPRVRPEKVTARAAPAIEALIREARLGGQVSFAVVDTGTGRILESHRGATGQPPASVTKAITALYALDVLGPGHRFETRLLATGPVEGGVLKGDLILAGGADPTLDTDGLAALASKLKKSGVHTVTGKLRVWGGALPFERVVDATQPEHVAYNPSISGISLNYNRVYFGWKRAGSDYTLMMDARSAKHRPDVRVARISVVTRATPVYTYSDEGDHDAWTVARRALGNGGARWLPVRKPAAYAAEVFSIFLRAHGIKVETGRALADAGPPGGRVLARHRSAPLAEILRGMLKYSNNLTAEMVGMAASSRRRGQPVALRASALAMSRWARRELGLGDAHLVDHSGLGEASRLGATALARGLAPGQRAERLKPLLKPFAMRDDAGEVDPDHPVDVAAKTGTLYFVSSLAGYMTTPDGTELAFAIFTANPDLRAGFDRASGQRPEGARGWNARAKRLQQRLIERWSMVYAS